MSAVTSQKTVWVVIPARHASTRFPGKMLADIKGKPLIRRVWEVVGTARSVSRILIATDHEDIFNAARDFGAEVHMTSPELSSGTDRVAAVTVGCRADWIVNVQGDEPMMRGEILDEFIGALGDFPMATLARKITDPDDILNPNVVKVVSDFAGKALYFSRSQIPYPREPGAAVEHWQHLGIYAYRPEVLQKLVKLPPSPLEQAEKLEQLRALQNGIAIQVLPTNLESIGVDTPEDLKRVLRYF